MSIEIAPLTGACGAEISGVSLKSLSNAEFDTIHSALLDYGAIFFRDQDLDHQSQIEFARRFGTLEVHPIVDGLEEHPEITRVLKPAGESASFGTGWHTDNSFFKKPSMGSVLYSKIIPPFGGDTLYASQTLAYDRLSERMKEMIDGLNAVHSASRAYTAPTTKDKYDKKAAITYTWTDEIMDEVIHPVVITIPETGRKALYVNDMFTLRFDGMSEEESRPLLSYLFHHATRPEFCCRFRWTPNTVAMWDNRIVQHYAVDDYQAYERLMYRVTIAGEVPV